MSLTTSLHKEPKVKFHEVPAGGLEFSFSQETKELNSYLQDVLGDEQNYKAHLSLKTLESMVQLKGNLEANVSQQCSRCGEEFKAPVSKNFVIAFYKSEDSIKSLSSGIDDLEGSFDLEFLQGNEINLGEVVHEQVALEIPFQPLCSESCQGLCTFCGINLNLEKCSCNKNELKMMREELSPFSTLKSLIGEQ